VVTGAGGLVGPAVVQRLHGNGDQVLAHVGPHGVDLVEPPDGVESCRADITDATAVRDLCRDAGAVVHLAGPPSVAASFRDPVGCVRTHVVGTACVLEACLAAGVHRVVYVSSAEVYGRAAEDVVPESAALRPVSPYGAAKLAAESLVHAMADRKGFDAVVLRPFSVYGAASPPTSLVGAVARMAARADRVQVHSLAPRRDYVHVTDVAAAVEAALDVATTRSRTFNVGSGRATSVADVIALALAAAGRDVPVEESADGDRPAGIDVLRLVADVSSARDELGWAARVPLATGIGEAVRARL
jgi:UDP-glucose 4-epimerase